MVYIQTLYNMGTVCALPTSTLSMSIPKVCLQWEKLRHTLDFTIDLQFCPDIVLCCAVDDSHRPSLVISSASNNKPHTITHAAWWHHTTMWVAHWFNHNTHCASSWLLFCLAFVGLFFSPREQLIAHSGVSCLFWIILLVVSNDLS